MTKHKEYTDASAAALAEALEKAKSVDVREDASQKEVDDALDALKQNI